MSAARRSQTIPPLLSILALSSVALTTLAGCAEQPTSTARADRSARQIVHPTISQQTRLAGDSLFLALGREVPAFGGFFFDKAGDIVVYLTDSTAIGSIGPRVRALVSGRIHGRRTPDAMGQRLIVRHADYPFLELALYRTRLRDEVFSIPGVAALGVDESINRVSIGITDESAAAAVVSLLARLQIPSAAVIVRPRGYVEPLQTLDDHHNGGIQGGWNTNGCTIGFPAIWRNDAVFVTASHCTQVPFGQDNPPKQFYQPNNFYPRIGQETFDPSWYSCGFLGNSQCRNSDAAVIAADVPIDIGKIARTTYASGTYGQNGSLIIDAVNPAFTITSRSDRSFQGERLDKVGNTTGWTYGTVDATCVDDSGTDGYVRECTDEVALWSDHGDSGSPVFFWKADGTAELRGILWGGAAGGDMVMSDLHQVELDLGALIVQDLPLSVSIGGPRVVPPFARCSWQANVHGGLPPNTYEWRRAGIVVSTTDLYAGETDEAGFGVNLTVTDSRNAVDQTSLFVTTDTSATDGQCDV